MNNIRYMNPRGRRGSNQHRVKHQGLNPKLKRELRFLGWALLVLTALFLYRENKLREFSKSIVSPIPVRAFAEEFSDEYKQPPMADLSERDAMIQVIKQVWRKDWRVGVAIASCESGLNHTRTNTHNSDHTTDYGLFQVNSIHGMNPTDMMNAVANAGYAYSLYVEQGLNPWQSSKKCWEERI